MPAYRPGPSFAPGQAPAQPGLAGPPTMTAPIPPGQPPYAQGPAGQPGYAGPAAYAPIPGAYGSPQQPPPGWVPMDPAHAAAAAAAARRQAKLARPWFKKKRFVLPIGAGALLTLGSVAGGGQGTATTAPSAPTSVAPAGAAPAQSAGPAQPAQPKAQAQKTQTGSGGSTGAKSAAPAPAKPAGVAGIGDSVRNGDFKITITKVRGGVRSVGSQYLGEKAQGQFYLVNIKAKNVGDESKYLLGDDVKLVDAKGREFSVNSMASIYVSENNPLLEEINPGNTSRGTLVFDLPRKAKPVSAVIDAGGLFDESVTIDLTS